MTRTLVFDLDGTLADTARDLIPSLNRTIARDGLAPVSVSEVGQVIGHGARAMIERAYSLRKQKLASTRLDMLFDSFLEDYGRNISEHTVLFDGTIAAMQRFADDGWRLAICTNKSIALTRLLLERLAVREKFAAVTGGDSFAYKKPDPRHLTETIRLAGGRREHSVMVGDSATDIRTAKAAGIPVVAVDFGYADGPIAALGADSVISHYDELWNAVQALARQAAG